MIKILHVYHDLMNLYGDWANAEVLALELKTRGYEASVDKKSVGDKLLFENYDAVYIGSATERSLIACIYDIMHYKAQLLKRIEDGMQVLATGNSHELFGKAVTDVSGKRHETLGLLDFETVQGSARVTGDCVCKASFLGDRLVGFINRASIGQSGDIDRPFTDELGPGANEKSNAEGIKYKNLLGTYLTGPVLIRNPPLLRYIADSIIGCEAEKEDVRADLSGNKSFFIFQEKAYAMALSELTARIGRT